MDKIPKPSDFKKRDDRLKMEQLWNDYNDDVDDATWRTYWQQNGYKNNNNYTRYFKDMPKLD